MKHKTYKRQIREANLIKYRGKPPSKELVSKILEESKLSRRWFEITYGIVEKTIERYLYGLRGMPVYYWHIFYEFNNLEKYYSNFIVKQKKKIIKQVREMPKAVIPETNKNLIDVYRARINK